MPETTKPLTLSDVLTAIASGAADENLDAVYHAYRERHKTLANIRAASALATFKIGDRCRFGNNVKPRTLAGVEVVITGKNRTGTKFQCERADGGPFAESWNVPPALLEKVTA